MATNTRLNEIFYMYIKEYEILDNLCNIQGTDVAGTDIRLTAVNYNNMTGRIYALRGLYVF